MPSSFRSAGISKRCMLGVVALLAAGCAGVAPQPTPSGPPPGPYTQPPSSASAAAPPANVNLQGFPLEYRTGYRDGCASASGAERKDATRFKYDGQYRTGWQDGNSICKKQR
jgi:hypothetical protein